MSGVKGDLSKLSRIAKALPTTVIAQRVAAKASPAITARVQRTFLASERADGTGWAPGRDGRTITLRRSGALFAKVQFVSTGTRMRAVLGVPWAKYQLGKRPVFPGGRIPADWSGDIKRISIGEIEADLKRGR